ncbi:MAG: UDP-N-acetylglucosamine 1-carboxyvinyltransferase [Candidatus Levybacteria bacterium CG_4_10_14_0_2_um_filter_36_16]|nr:MAG: UDP-N-acetylglucosamine 1-carboxyvinyltransferase [Candidatus Levybacteria bacterium CG2_30_37_29]PIR79078.1 MAG: UDP-N-acetylglucosamine 1-carboxyvinyltransferase [Candidatus Levybacteria bacterium CG10_big_fil_rev_8_21_14_0_10_36_30]PIZ97220.1 MAG: UDP-N-acetylglucosamine 1-carboxyvinyltransferase [Candidatus Levybacteria bacterium CG_4_10_14_0_2_um_filter_36_16]PJA90683.1 MAG: UDP-N-acetylglucosamine 1-carboxyvinyltransferase [Candidatus Levybacteria bacterium CG_4_9_14_3_um_filter_36
MKRYIITGVKKLKGDVYVSGSKNVVLKTVIAACLTSEVVEIKNVPLISDFFVILELVREIGGDVVLSGHTVKIHVPHIKTVKLPLEIGAKIRTSSMFLAPLLARNKEAFIPNPGGCRIGARPIDRHIEGLEKMGAKISYHTEDGYFYAKTDGLCGANYTFEKNSHTGTETLIMAAVLAKGKTIIDNAAEEPEVDDLIGFLVSMGAKIERTATRTIVIEGVTALHGTTYEIMPDRNEVVTFAICSALTGGGIIIKNAQLKDLDTFLLYFKNAGGEWEEKDGGVRFFIKDMIVPVNVTTGPHPGFMTDWQGAWAVLMTQSVGTSLIHETVYENRFSYIGELEKMGAKIEFLMPSVKNPEKVYNFNYEHDKKNEYRQEVRIKGKTPFHNAVLTIADLRAGATIVLAALIATGESVIFGIEHLERGYEAFDSRLASIGVDIDVVEEKI